VKLLKVEAHWHLTLYTVREYLAPLDIPQDSTTVKKLRSLQINRLTSTITDGGNAPLAWALLRKLLFGVVPR
jgi:hypothetical protein